MKFFSPEVCISTNLPYGHTWNTSVMSGLVHLAATWNCQISYKNVYVRLLVLHLLLLLNPWIIVQMYYFGSCSSELIQLVPFGFRESGLFVILIDCIFFLSPFLTVTRISISTVFFLAQLDFECFPLTMIYHLNCFESRVKRHLLTVGSF